jgi:hypothetical protein
MPFAEATNDQTVIRGAGVESREHAAPPALELSLVITRPARDLSGVRDQLRVLRGRRLEARLGAGLISQRHAGKQRDPDDGAERDASAAAVQVRLVIRRDDV